MQISIPSIFLLALFGLLVHNIHTVNTEPIIATEIGQIADTTLNVFEDTTPSFIVESTTEEVTTEYPINTDDDPQFDSKKHQSNLSEGKKYCKIRCFNTPSEPNETHTACGGCPVSKDLVIKNTFLSNKEKQKIIDLHNQRRNELALGLVPNYLEQAADMRAISWDDELAMIAQCWANSGEKIRHDKCRDVERMHVGQNLGISGFDSLEETTRQSTPGKTKLLEDIVNSWFEEYSLGVQEDMTNLTEDIFSKGLGHFTQMCWAKTYLIGCGKSYYQEGEFFFLYIVCNYGPAGNYITEPVYTFGKPCSACPEGTLCDEKYPGLCS